MLFVNVDIMMVVCGFLCVGRGIYSKREIKLRGLKATYKMLLTRRNQPFLFTLFSYFMFGASALFSYVSFIGNSLFLPSGL